MTDTVKVYDYDETLTNRLTYYFYHQLQDCSPYYTSQYAIEYVTGQSEAGKEARYGFKNELTLTHTAENPMAIAVYVDSRELVRQSAQLLLGEEYKLRPIPYKHRPGKQIGIKHKIDNQGHYFLTDKYDVYINGKKQNLPPVMICYLPKTNSEEHMDGMKSYGRKAPMIREIQRYHSKGSQERVNVDYFDDNIHDCAEAWKTLSHSGVTTYQVDKKSSEFKAQKVTNVDKGQPELSEKSYNQNGEEFQAIESGYSTAILQHEDNKVRTPSPVIFFKAGTEETVANTPPPCIFYV